MVRFDSRVHHFVLNAARIVAESLRNFSSLLHAVGKENISSQSVNWQVVNKVMLR